ncbi:hypothetical protein ACP70R_008506 [Stipagrostis hirtigluma subsp. patula]
MASLGRLKPSPPYSAGRRGRCNANRTSGGLIHMIDIIS